jgi:hypothetical protein
VIGQWRAAFIAKAAMYFFGRPEEGGLASCPCEMRLISGDQRAKEIAELLLAHAAMADRGTP